MLTAVSSANLLLHPKRASGGAVRNATNAAKLYNRAQCPALERERALGEVLWEDKMFLVIAIWFIAAVALAVLFGFAVETGRGE